jgi:hypothetical protein
MWQQRMVREQGRSYWRANREEGEKYLTYIKMDG